jgi:nucleotide-binding universal stress UspA family protein
MTVPTPSADAPPEMSGVVQPASGERIFLVVVDETEEMRNALHFACRRAEHTGGRVAMLYVLEPPEFQHWLGVERVMQDEAREQAEQTLQELAAKAQAMTGRMPVLIIREGRRSEEVLALLQEEPSISIVVLGTAPGRQDPGPLVNYLVSRMGDTVRVPLTLVPGQLTEEQIDQLA